MISSVEKRPKRDSPTSLSLVEQLITQLFKTSLENHCYLRPVHHYDPILTTMKKIYITRAQKTRPV